MPSIVDTGHIIFSKAGYLLMPDSGKEETGGVKGAIFQKSLPDITNLSRNFGKHSGSSSFFEKQILYRSKSIVL